ncbi:protein kinase-like protein [Streptomyces sp. TLI_235]|nr:serine/threonine-protein kinase [Streptomyces sp. TLI_235]PBC67403.1 protein kinase-like protein [Streptomyces sp. TLI_235]
MDGAGRGYLWLAAEAPSAGLFDLPVVSAATLVAVVVALAVRAVSWPLLTRSRQGLRNRALAAEAADPSEDLPLHPGAVAGERLLAVVVAAVTLLLVLKVFDPVHLYPVWPASPLSFGPDYSPVGERLAGHLVSAVPLLLGWLWLWYANRRELWTTGTASVLWNAPATRRTIAVGLGAGALLGVLVLPLGVVAALLALQLAEFAVGRRRRGAAAPDPGTPPPVAPDRSTPSAAPAAPVRTPPQTAAPAASAVPHQLLRSHEPRRLGDYHLLGRIGAGGMGTVYLARREGSATQVALKTINPELIEDEQLLRRFEREAEVLAMVPGAYTARVLDAGVAEGRPYLAMELLDGRPLDAHLRDLGPIGSPEALRALALALAAALAGVHRLGLVHRDLKPANIMLTSAGPRLLDFGIAAIVDGTRLTRTGGGPGTLTYMAPEQFGDDPVGAPADVWAWACCVVCAAHGASPFAAASTGAVIRRIVDSGPDRAAIDALAARDPALADVVRRSLAPEPADRPADGAALLVRLNGPQGPGHTAPDARALGDEITRGWRTLVL